MTQVLRYHKPKHLHLFSSWKLSAALRIFSVLCCRKWGSCSRAAADSPFESLLIISIYPVCSQAFKPDFSPIFPPTAAGQQGNVPQRPAHDLRPDRVEIPDPLWDPAPRWAQGAEKESDCQNWLWQQVCEQNSPSFSAWIQIWIQITPCKTHQLSVSSWRILFFSPWSCRWNICVFTLLLQQDKDWSWGSIFKVQYVKWNPSLSLDGIINLTMVWSCNFLRPIQKCKYCLPWK